MNLEGRRAAGVPPQLDAIEDPPRREAAYQSLVAGLRARQGLNLASHLEIDDVIDPPTPAAHRQLAPCARCHRPARTGRKHPVDPW